MLRIAIGLILAFVSTRIAAHDLPPGVVERTIQATVHANRLEIVYRFGMSESTMRDELSRMGFDPVAERMALERQFLDVLSPRVGVGLIVTLDGAPCRLLEAANDLIYQHHAQFECRLTYGEPIGITAGRLVIEDRNFPELPGHFRVALKGRDKDLVESTDAAPILVRAERMTTRKVDASTIVRPRIEATLRRAADGTRPADRSLVTGAVVKGTEPESRSTSAPLTGSVDAVGGPPADGTPLGWLWWTLVVAVLLLSAWPLLVNRSKSRRERLDP